MRPTNIGSVVTFKHIGDDVRQLSDPTVFAHHRILSYLAGGSLASMSSEPKIGKYDGIVARAGAIASAFHAGIAMDEFIKMTIGSASRLYITSPLLFELTRKSARDAMRRILQAEGTRVVTNVEVGPLADTIGDLYTAALSAVQAVLFPEGMISDIPLGRYIASKEAVQYAFADKIIGEKLKLGQGSSGSPMGGGNVISYARIIDAIRSTVTSISETMSELMRLYLRLERVRRYANASFVAGISNQAMYDVVDRILSIANFHIWKNEEFTAPDENISELIQIEIDDVLGNLRSAPLLKEHIASSFVQQYMRRRIKAKRADTDMIVFLHRNIVESNEAPPTLAVHTLIEDITAIRRVPDDLGSTQKLVSDIANVSGGDGFQALAALRESDIERTLFTDLPHDEMLALAMCLSDFISYSDSGIRTYFSFRSQRPFPNEIATATRAVGTDTFKSESIADVLIMTPDVQGVSNIPVSSGLLAFVAHNKNRLTVVGKTDGTWREADTAELIKATVYAPIGRYRFGAIESGDKAVNDFDTAIATDNLDTITGTATLTKRATSVIETGGPPVLGGQAYTLRAVISLSSALDLTFALTKLGIAKDTREVIATRTWPFSAAIDLLTAQESSKTEEEKAKYWVSRFIHVPVPDAPTDDVAREIALKENSSDPRPLPPLELAAAAERIRDLARRERIVHFLPFDKLGTPDERGLALSLITQSLVSYYIPLITSPTIRRLVADIFAYVRYPFMEPEGIEESTNYVNVAHAVLKALAKRLGFMNGYTAMLDAIHGSSLTMQYVVQNIATTRSGARFGSR